MKSTECNIRPFSVVVPLLLGAALFFGNTAFAEVDCEGIAITAGSAGDCSVKCTATYGGASGNYAAPPASGFKGKANSCSSSGNCCCTGGSVPAPAVTSCVSGGGGGGTGAAGTGTGAGVTRGGGASSAGTSGGDTCSGRFLTAPAAKCGIACREIGWSITKYIADPSGVMKCCCYGARLPGHTVGRGTFGSNVANPFGEAYDVPKLVGNTLRRFMGILGIIALVIFIYGGFLWMISLGDETRVKRGRETMIWAGMGLIAIVGSYVVIQFILDTVLAPPRPTTSTSSPPSTAGSISSSSVAGGAGGGTGSSASTGTGGTSSGGGGSAGSGSTGGSAGGGSGSSGSAGSGAAGTSGTGSGASTGTSGTSSGGSGGSGSSGGSQQSESTASPDFYVTPPAQPTISVYAANNIDTLTARYETTLDKTTGMVTTSGGYHQPLGAMSFGKDGSVPYVEEFHIYESSEKKLVFFSKNSDGTEMATKVGDDGSFSIDALSYTAAEPSQMVKWNIDGGAAHAFNSQGFKFAEGGSVNINSFLAYGKFNTPDGGSISLDRPDGVVVNYVDIKTGEDRGGGSIAGGYDYP